MLYYNHKVNISNFNYIHVCSNRCCIDVYHYQDGDYVKTMLAFSAYINRNLKNYETKFTYGSLTCRQEKFFPCSNT